MQDSPQRPALRTSDEFITIVGLWHICLDHWKWFVITLTLFLSMGFYYLLSTPKTYTRWASLLIKEENLGQGMMPNNMQEEFNNIGLVNQRTNVSNVHQHLVSLDVLTDVVKQLHLEVSYCVEGRLKNTTLYGSSLPLTVSFPEAKPSDFISFHIEMRPDSTLLLYGFQKTGVGMEEIQFTKKGQIELQSPIGRILLLPNPGYEGAMLQKPISIHRTSLLSAAADTKGKLHTEISNDKSTIISLRYRDTSIERAEDVLNSMVRVYNRKWIEEKNKMAVNTYAFIEDRLRLIEEELELVDDSISSYKSRHGITELKDVGDLYLKKYSESDNELFRLRNQRMLTEHLLAILQQKEKEYRVLPSEPISGNPTIETQINEYNELVMQINHHLVYTSRQNPLILSLERQLEKLRGNIIYSLQSQIKTIDIQLYSLQDYSGEATSRIESNPSQAKHLVSVERQQKVKEGLYIYLLQKREETELTRSYATDIVQMIDMPFGSDAPSSPISRNVIAVCLILGVLLPALVLFIRASLDNTVHTREEIQRQINVPVVGEVPLFRSKKGKKRGDKSKEMCVPIVIEDGSRNIVNEAFRVLRSNLDFLKQEGERKENIFLITSMYVGSGKSFISLNLSVAVAIQNKKVLFIDADLRRASASRIWNSPLLGLSNYLNGSLNLKSAIYRDKKYPNLHYMPVGTQPPNPTELLTNNRFRELCDVVREEYDYIFIDTPPMENIADASIIAKYVDRSIFVVRVGMFKRNRLYQLEEFNQSNLIKKMLIVLNESTQFNQGGYRYSDYYSYY